MIQVEQLKKQKAKKLGSKSEDKEKPLAEASKAEDKDEKATDDAPENELEPPEVTTGATEKQEDAPAADSETSDDTKLRNRAPSLSVQSKLRSSSFKQGGPLSPTSAFTPDGDTAPEIYRKQAARIEELEKENKRLVKEATDGEKRWKKAEEELEVIREDDSSRPASKAGMQSSEELDRLVSPPSSSMLNFADDTQKAELASLQRQNAQLTAQSSRSIRHGSSPSVSTLASNDMAAQLASKSSTIESMEIEISNLKAQLARTASGSSAEKEQISALEAKLMRTERALETSQRELMDLKKNLESTTAKAVKEGSERTSAETKLKTLTREAEEAKSQSEELQRRILSLEKKVTTLTTLHKEHDARSQALKKEREKADKDAAELRSKLGNAENEASRLREEKERLKKRDAQGVDDDGVDELEDEERQKLEAKIRELEAEVYDLRRGVWRERRGQIDGDHSAVTSPGFQDIDLSGASHTRVPQGGKPFGGVGDFFSAFTGQTQGNDDLLDDDEMDFDEEAFRLAQQEEAKKRIERVKEIKRALPDWKRFRLDIVETRKGGTEGAGEIFEV